MSSGAICSDTPAVRLFPWESMQAHSNIQTIVFGLLDETPLFLLLLFFYCRRADDVVNRANFLGSRKMVKWMRWFQSEWWMVSAIRSNGFAGIFKWKFHTQPNLIANALKYVRDIGYQQTLSTPGRINHPQTKHVCFFCYCRLNATHTLTLRSLYWLWNCHVRKRKNKIKWEKSNDAK